jgi:hypothetical protein
MKPEPLPWAGYQKHRKGRLHLFCPACHRKMSNVPRGPMDPPSAVLSHTYCERCSEGCKESPELFFDEQGRPLCNFCGRQSCELAGGRQECDERLVNAHVKRIQSRAVR